MPEPPPGSETKKALPELPAFIIGNFASVSAIGLFAITVYSTIFVYAYLSMFDWRLIWIVEYSDILKIGLVALGIISGVLVSMLGLVFFF